MNKTVFLCAVAVFLSFSLSAQQPLSDAAGMLENGDFSGAEAALKACEAVYGGEAAWYLTLAAVYEKQKLFEQAVDVLKQGYYRIGGQKEIAFNLANNLYALERWDEAAEFYGEALKADSTFAAAYLNRGNTLLRSGKYAQAAEDYGRVLAFAPDHPQKASIERMISLLTEEERLAAERATAAEQVRLERERRLAEIRGEVEDELSGLDKSKNLQTDNTGLEDYMLNLDIVE